MYNDLFSIGGLTIHTYGVMMGLGVLIAIFWSYRRAKARGMNDDLVFDIAVWAVILGFIGAKAVYILTTWKSFMADPWGSLTSEGFVVYGGLIIGVAVAMWRCKRAGAKFLDYLDLAIVPISLAQVCGRIGCFMAGCCYGKPTQSFIGVTFPTGSHAPSGVPLWPTQLISVVGDLIICLILLKYEKKKKLSGQVAGLYMILYAIGRFIIEFLRDDPRGGIGPFSTSQIISVFILILGIYLMRLEAKKLAAAEAASKAESEEDEDEDDEESDDDEDDDESEEEDDESDEDDESENEDEVEEPEEEAEAEDEETEEDAVSDGE